MVKIQIAAVQAIM